MSLDVEEGVRHEYPEYIEVFLRKGVGSIHHVVWKILGVPLPQIVSRFAGITYRRFIREYKWSLEAAPNVIDEVISDATRVYGVYDKEVISVRIVSGRQAEITVVGFGGKYARDNKVIVTIPISLTGFQAVRGLYIHEYTDAVGEKFYLVFDGAQPKPWMILDDKRRAMAIADRIKMLIAREIEKLSREFRPPFVIDPITDRTYSVYTVSVKDKEFAYYHARKHVTKEVKVDNGMLTKPLLVVGEKWRYIWHIRPKIAGRLIYFYSYPENNL